MFVVPRFPSTWGARRALAVQTLPDLMQRWGLLALPIPRALYVLVFRPEQLGPSTAAATHRADQMAALVADRGGAGVAVSLSDTRADVEDYVVVTLVCSGRPPAPYQEMMTRPTRFDSGTGP